MKEWVWEWKEISREKVLWFGCNCGVLWYIVVAMWTEKLNEHISVVLSKIQSSWEVSFPFLLVETWGSSWGFSFLEKTSLEMLWGFTQDLLVLRDLSLELEKKNHALRVEVKSWEQRVKTEKYWVCLDWWAREITQWISLAPAGWLKIVLIENVQRMTIWAANALLKTFEEPLPWRLILGTVWSAEWLLDTIRSRAMIFPYRNAVDSNFDQMVKKYWQKYKNGVLSQWYALTQWNIAEFEDLLERWEKQLKRFWELESHVFVSWKSYAIPWIVKDLRWFWTDRELLDSLLYRAEYLKKYDQIEKLKTAQSMIERNVWVDQVWFWLGLA